MCCLWTKNSVTFFPYLYSPIQSNPLQIAGNIEFRNILEQNLQAYTSANDAGKRDLVKRLADHMRKSLGMRFLKQAKDGITWTTVQDKVVIQQKFYQTFRSLRAGASSK